MNKSQSDKLAFSINVGIINYLYKDVIIEDWRNEESIARVLMEATLNAQLKKTTSIPLEVVLKEKNTISIGGDSESTAEKSEALHRFLISKGYLPMVIEEKVFPLYPVSIELGPEEPEYPLYFALRLASLSLTELDNFLSFQYGQSFNYEKARYFRFLPLCIREYKEHFLSEDILKTSEEWMELKNKEEGQVEKKNKTLPMGTKIICKATLETIQQYFYQLEKYKIFTKEEINHILYYSFVGFDKEVPAQKFTPQQIKKGELMKFIQHFYTLYAFAKSEAGNWIKLLLVDSTNVFDSPDRTEEATIEYIKDNWSKEPHVYRFRRP